MIQGGDFSEGELLIVNDLHGVENLGFVSKYYPFEKNPGFISSAASFVTYSSWFQLNNIESSIKATLGWIAAVNVFLLSRRADCEHAQTSGSGELNNVQCSLPVQQVYV